MEPDFTSRLYKHTISASIKKNEKKDEPVSPSFNWKLVTSTNAKPHEGKKIPPAIKYEVKSKLMHHTESSKKLLQKQQEEDAAKAKAIKSPPIGDHSRLFAKTKASEAAHWSKPLEKQNSASKKPFSPSGPRVQLNLEKQISSLQKVINHKLDKIKSRLFAPTHCSTLAKYVPPDPNEEVMQVLPGTKIDYGVKSRLFNQTAAMRNAKYVPPQQEETPKKKYRVVLKRTFSDSDLLALQEKRAERIRSRSQSAHNSRSTTPLARRHSDASIDFKSPRMTKLALQRLNRDRDNREGSSQCDRMSISESAHSNYGCYNNKYNRDHYIYPNSKGGTRSANCSVTGSVHDNTTVSTLLTSDERRQAKQRLYTSKPAHQKRDFSPQRYVGDLLVQLHLSPPSMEKKPPLSPEERRQAMERLCRPNASMIHSQWIPSEYQLREKAGKLCQYQTDEYYQAGSVTPLKVTPVKPTDSPQVAAVLTPPKPIASELKPEGIRTLAPSTLKTHAINVSTAPTTDQVKQPTAPTVVTAVSVAAATAASSQPTEKPTSANPALNRKMSGSPIMFRSGPSLERLFPGIVSPTAQRFTPSSDSCFVSAKMSPVQQIQSQPADVAASQLSTNSPKAAPGTLQRTQSASNVNAAPIVAPDPTIIQIEPNDGPRRKGQLPILSLTTLSATRSASNLLDPASMYAASLNAVNNSEKDIDGGSKPPSSKGPEPEEF